VPWHQYALISLTYEKTNGSSWPSTCIICYRYRHLPDFQLRRHPQGVEGRTTEALGDKYAIGGNDEIAARVKQRLRPFRTLFQVRPGEHRHSRPSGSGKPRCWPPLVSSMNDPRQLADGQPLPLIGCRVGLKRIRREKLGFIFQAHNLIPFLTALENVMIALEINQLPRTEAKKRATELLTSLNIGHRLNNYPSALSGGEAQRVAIARALANRPKVIC
jgi:energy-coupling factor transporter ATP-binding protein EcfA2